MQVTSWSKKEKSTNKEDNCNCRYVEFKVDLTGISNFTTTYESTTIYTLNDMSLIVRRNKQKTEKCLFFSRDFI